MTTSITIASLCFIAVCAVGCAPVGCAPVDAELGEECTVTPICGASDNCEAT